MNDKVSSRCWSKELKLISSVQKKEAVELRGGEPCATDCKECQRFLGWCNYEYGDFNKATYWFSMSSENKDAESLYGLACVNYAQKKDKEALKQFKQALSLGFTRSYFWLGLMNEYGLGTEINIEMAKDYYLRGAQCGYLVSERALLQTTFRYGTYQQKIVGALTYFALIYKCLKIALKDRSDERLADIPKNKMQDFGR